MGGLIVAVDGGGSKTDVVALRPDGSVAGAARGLATNPQVETLPVAVSRIDALVEEATGGADVAYASVYLAGLDLAVEIERFTAAIAPLRWTRAGLAVDNDLFALLRTGTRSADAVAVVCGTGINAVGVRADGGTARFPALGTITGDWGGGSGVMLAALWHAARAEDGRGPATTLAAALPSELGLPSVQAIGEAILLGDLPVAALTPLTPALFRAAQAGDGIAGRLLDRQAEEIATMARVCAARLELPSAGLPVVLGGGLIRSGERRLLDPLLVRLEEALPGAEPIVVEEHPIVGAGLGALAAAGGDAASLDRARTALAAREAQAV
ncbi:N-acetylglucosamine kinase [Pseudolysinimonas sp.]|uniref:N-acetylglucosamine kinase n=1 Tax=Pseudolysinimonas sp. TaxID=2680009 RepID=UPI003F7DFC59